MGPMRLLALDLGDRTIGVAGCDELGLTTSPLYTIRRGRLDNDLDRILETAREREVERILVGLPVSMDGTEGERARKTRAFAVKLAARTALPVILWDERLSTFEAESILRESGVNWRKRKELIDQVAAEVILRSYLEAGCPDSDPEGPALPATEEPREDAPKRKS
ncbi:MAG: Holliday junction resolvase RuvX [Myxococcota bacterium]